MEQGGVSGENNTLSNIFVQLSAGCAAVRCTCVPDRWSDDYDAATTAAAARILHDKFV